MPLSVSLGRRSLIALIILLLANYAAAQAGSLDTTFATGGIFTTSTVEGTATSVAIQSDGKIVFGGISIAGVNFANTLIRLNTNGTLDTTFGSGGIATVIPGGGFFAVAIQSNGDIVAAGSQSPSANSIVQVARFLSNGTLDSTFGTGGISTTKAIPFTLFSGGAMALQSNGDIVVAASNPGVMARFTSAGQLDTTFGTEGIVNLANGNPTQVVVLASGKILVAAGVPAPTPAPQAGIVSRYNSNGALDTTFGSAGMVSSITSASAMAVQSNDKIIVAGALTSRIGTPPAANDAGFGIARYNSTGNIDLTFGTRGAAIIDFGTANPLSGAFALAIQSNGDIVAGGAAAQGPFNFNFNFNSIFGLARVTNTGALDTTFGTGGIVTTTILSGTGIYSYVAGMAIQSNGDIVVAGTTNIPSNGDPSLTNGNVARYLGE